MAARIGRVDIAVGNIMGSNIFNALGVMGIPAMIATLPATADMMYFALPVLVASTLLFTFVVVDREVTVWEGIMLVTFYAYFVAKLIGV